MEREATFGAGCFWCIEPVFSQLKGVNSTFPGYAGGRIKNPSYKDVCRNDTGFIEVLSVIFDDEIISYPKLLEVFWFSHDPTTQDRQGYDVGEQYRSIIFTHNEEQQIIAEEYKEKLNQSKAYEEPIVTVIKPIENFYTAEAYHKDYYKNNPEAAYCANVIRPKVEKFRKVFAELLK